MKIKSLISSGVSTLTDSIFYGLNNIFTSDDERGKIAVLKLQVNKDLVAVQNQLTARLESEVTKRHAADMKSDSWLSKNVRPLAVIFLTVMCVLYAFSVTFSTLTTEQIEASASFSVPLFSLTGTAYGFYFYGRTSEKREAMRND